MLAIRLSAALVIFAVAAVTSAASAETTPPVPALGPDFKVVANGTEPLPGRCDPSFVVPQIASVLDAFNAGHAVVFARHFVTTGYFEPYNGRPGRTYRARGRTAISSVVRARHRAGDGWTAFQLTTPVWQYPNYPLSQGIFGLFLRVSADGIAFQQGVKVVVSCSTGQIHRWLGPAWTR